MPGQMTAPAEPHHDQRLRVIGVMHLRLGSPAVRTSGSLDDPAFSCMARGCPGQSTFARLRGEFAVCRAMLAHPRCVTAGAVSLAGSPRVRAALATALDEFRARVHGFLLEAVASAA